MTGNKEYIKKSGEGFYRIFELVTKSIGWLQIVASPLLIGLAIGAAIYFSDTTTTRLFIGMAIAAVGLIVGIICAKKQWKSKGTIWFMTRIMANPELDNADEERKSETKVSDK